VSNENLQNKSRRGGHRPGAGRPNTGITKTKISVTVDQRVLRRAASRWKRKLSPLVEMLLDRYATTKQN
jgi:hypothetical protein